MYLRHPVRDATQIRTDATQTNRYKVQGGYDQQAPSNYRSLLQKRPIKEISFAGYRRFNRAFLQKRPIFCKRDLSFAKESGNFKEPTNRSHSIAAKQHQLSAKQTTSYCIFIYIYHKYICIYIYIQQTRLIYIYIYIIYIYVYIYTHSRLVVMHRRLVYCLV